MAKVSTIRGLVDFSELSVKDEVYLNDDCRRVVTTWTFNDDGSEARVAVFDNQLRTTWTFNDDDYPGKVNTVRGLVDIGTLQVAHDVQYTDTTREIGITWTFKDGTLARRDAWVDMLRTQAQMDAEAGKLNVG